MRIGDTVKFGRVRFKVIMLQNRPEGEQTYRESKFNQKTPADRKDRQRAHQNQHLSSYRNTLSGEDDDEEEEEEREEEFEEEERIVPEEEVAL